MFKFIRFLFTTCTSLLLVLTSVAQESIRINHKPYLQALTDSSVSILWTTNQPAIAWVEIAPDDGTHFYKVERPKLYASSHGFKNVSKVHQVNIKNLKPNTTYRYRVYSQEVVKHEGVNVQYGKTVATDVWRAQPFRFTTNGPASSFNFAVVNDIHGRNDLLKNLLGQVDFQQNDFIVFNGDMMNDLRSESQMFGGFMDTAIALFASETPMYYARGNHETRGPFASEFIKYFPSPSGHLYYAFTKGDACFIVLDSGEDKPDSDIEYSGIVDMDNYRTEQAQWLKNVLSSDMYKRAKYKIVISHMPPFGGWHGNDDIAQKFVPLLNDAGAHIMLSGHMHRHVVQQANDVTKFPIIVNKNDHILKVEVNSENAVFRMFDEEGKFIEEVKINPN